MLSLRTILFIGACAFLVTAMGSATAQQLAFPTAEGFGRYAVGGRHGAVYIVSNLNDGGVGSLRACAEAVGPRTCVFSVAGEIRLKKRINIRNPFITIAGQSAPGEGVMLTNRGFSNLQQPLYIATNDVIVRHIRLRPGPSAQPSGNVDALLIGDAKNVILDHLSMSWGTDEVFNIVGNEGTLGTVQKPNTSNVTLQWSMIYEPLRFSTHTQAGDHSRAVLITSAQEISFHHNLIAHATRRNPNLGAIGQIDFVNNVVYNGGQYFGEVYDTHGTTNVNWVGNIAIAGPDTPKKADRHGANLFLNNALGTLNFYARDNFDVNRRSASDDERLVVDPKDWKYVRPTPVGYGALSLAPSSVSGPQQAYKDVLAFAGANRPGRDAADARVVNEVRTCAGGIIDNPAERGGWPVLSTGAAPQDADRDGMSDAWESARGLSPSDAADRNGDRNGDGYTNLEEYLNELAGDHLGSTVGRGQGVDADTTCNATIAPGAAVSINSFLATPPAVKPGGKITLTWDGTGNTCEKSWARELSPAITTGASSLTLKATRAFDFTCTRSNITDWVNVIAFVTPDGLLPKPVVTLTSDKTLYALGEPVTLSWIVGKARDNQAGECLASGGWNGFKSVLGSETFPAMTSGDYALTCTGPGGSTTRTIQVNIAGTPPVAPTAAATVIPTSDGD